ncbi:MAG: type II toxin-antitoxin system VapC family toxin [Cyanobacteria bacterium J06614_10]
MSRFLLDTNILSEPIKLSPNQRVAERVIENIPDIAVAAVSFHELLFGCLRMPDSRRKRAMDTYIKHNVIALLPILPYCESAAKWHAEERVRLQKTGKTPPYIDGQIAAIAAVKNLTLVTRNVKDFRHFQNLKIENWFE